MKEWYFPLVVVAVIALVLWSRGCSPTVVDDYSVLHDSVRVWKNKAGQYEAEKRSLEITSKDQLKKIDNLTGANARLQKLLSERGVDVGVSHDAVTTISQGTSTIVVPGEFPTYKGSLGDDWYSLDVVAGFDSITADLTVINRFDYAFRRKKRWFGPDTVYVWAKNLNPYTKTVDLSGGRYVVKPKRFGVGPVLGYGFAGSVPGAFIGVGASYHIIEF